MAFFLVDDILPFHSRIVAAGNAAVGLWTRAGAWSTGQLTDGFVPKEIALTMGKPAEIKKLVATGLWLEEEGGYRFFRWHEDGSGAKRQPTREEVELRRKAARDRKTKSRSRPADPRREPHDSTVEMPVTDAGVTPDVTRDGTRDERVTHTSLTRARTISSPSPSPSESGGAQKRPRRISEDFEITEAMRAWAAERVPGLDIDRSTEEFVSYWRGAGKPMVDWDQVWRNGMLKADSRGDHRKPSTMSVRERWANA